MIFTSSSQPWWYREASWVAVMLVENQTSFYTLSGSWPGPMISSLFPSPQCLQIPKPKPKEEEDGSPDG